MLASWRQGIGVCAAMAALPVTASTFAPSVASVAPSHAASRSVSVRPPDAAAIDQARRARALEGRALSRSDSADVRPLGRVHDAAAADSARATWDSLAQRQPEVRDWIVLRAVALDPDAARRAARLQSLTLPPARARRARTAAIALARHGSDGEAIAVLDSTDLTLAAELRLAGALDPAGGAVRDTVRGVLLTCLRTMIACDRARAALLLDSLFAPLDASDARAAASALAPVAPRRAIGLLRGIGAASPDDARLLATLLTRSGPSREAADAWLDVAATAREPSLRADARLQAARALVRAGDDARAVTLLRDVIATFPGDSAAAQAGWLLVDRAARADRLDEARVELAALQAQAATSRWTDRAVFDVALLGFTDDAAASGAALDSLAARAPAGDMAPGALYWAGRAALATGDTAGAMTRWRRVRDGHPLSYHAALAATRLQLPLVLPADATPDVADTAIVAGAARMATLEALGMMAEAALERAWMLELPRDTTTLLAAGAALVPSIRPSLGIRLVQRAIDSGATLTTSRLRLLYPWPHERLIRGEAAAQDVDPALAVALIRQESRFTADARSPVGARGLMQLMPEVARVLARRDGHVLTTAALDDPATNVRLGMRHLASDLRRWPSPAHALATRALYAQLYGAVGAADGGR